MEKETVITLPDNVDREWVTQSQILRKKAALIILDFFRTKRIETSAICLLQLLQKSSSQSGIRIVLRNIRPELLAVIQKSPAVHPAERAPGPLSRSFLVRAKESFSSSQETVKSALSVLVEMLYWGTFGILKKQDFRRGVLAEQMYLLGYKALGIVGLLSFLIGMVLALQAAIQLKAYGAGIFLGPLIGITMVREMGPLLTAVILAGRTGSATTAEIGTMSVGEEIDALRTMGINPVQFVVVPKFWAITVTMPLLSILSTIAGILGGYAIGLVYLDLASSLFWGELSKALFFRDVLAGFIKSVVFSWLIIWIGSFYGFKVRGGAESVGRETTASVVACIFIIIIADALFSFVL
ncbi:MAG: ABC transporter permease [Chitinispirillaceae bacterium]|nr:ABC transporter permease [Chitinispirillaceae bacterium]